jgi:hypothetical protein
MPPVLRSAMVLASLAVLTGTVTYFGAAETASAGGSRRKGVKRFIAVPEG